MCSHLIELKQEQSKRELLIHKEKQLKYAIDETEDKLHILQLEFNQFKETAKKQENSWKREKDLLIVENNKRISELEDQYNLTLVKNKAELNGKIQECNSKYQHCLREVEVITKETLQKKYEEEKHAAIYQIQKECAKEIEDNKKKISTQFQSELNQLQDAYRQREMQTSDDLTQLEHMYNLRIDKLESQIKLFKEKALEAEKRLEAYKSSTSQEAHEWKINSQKYEESMKLHEGKALEWKQKISQSNQLNNELINREKLLKEQCREVLIENKSLKDAIFQHNTHIQRLNSERLSLENKLKQSSYQDEAVFVSLEIAKQEALMLEKENHRLKHENQLLQGVVNRSDKILYGNGTRDILSDLNSKSPISTKLTANTITKTILNKHASPALRRSFGTR